MVKRAVFGGSVVRLALIVFVEDGGDGGTKDLGTAVLSRKSSYRGVNRRLRSVSPAGITKGVSRLGSGQAVPRTSPSSRTRAISISASADRHRAVSTSVSPAGAMG